MTNNSNDGNTGSVGLLLVNLGTPDSPSVGDVRRYLKEFLWDPRVVEAPRPLWWLVLNGIILNTRPRRSAAAYQKIWTEQGSPLLSISLDQGAALQESLKGEAKVVVAMRYGNPSIRQGLQELKQSGCDKVLVFPLYPQYSATTTASIFDAVSDELRNWRWIPELRLINQYYDNPGYIEALANSVRERWASHGKPEKLVMSFHGIPKEYAEAGDPYPGQCKETARLLAAALELADDQWVLCFQSRLGPKEWLQPYADKMLEQLPGKGVKKVDVICPGFSVDCLETLEEVAMENRDIFLEAGGEEYHYIPCLNDSPQHIEFLAQLARRYLGGWIES